MNGKEFLKMKKTNEGEELRVVGYKGQCLYPACAMLTYSNGIMI